MFKIHTYNSDTMKNRENSLTAKTKIKQVITLCSSSKSSVCRLFRAVRGSILHTAIHVTGMATYGLYSTPILYMRKEGNVRQRQQKST